MGLKKLIAVSMIFLFISVAVAPSINFTVVKASNDNDLVEVTSQACGIQGLGNTTVKLTKQQYQGLEQYLVNFRARLNQTTTRDEAIPLYKQAAIELNKYGLLPKGMSPKQAERLMIGQIPGVNISLVHTTGCLVMGSTSDTVIWTPLTIGLGLVSSLPFLLYAILGILAECYPSSLLLKLMSILGTVAIAPFAVSTFLSYFLPIAFLSIITLGLVITDMGRWAYIPSTGWVTTIGRTSQNWTGEFYGQFRMIPGLLCGRYLAIIGFTGIKIWQKSITKDFLYFGSALAVDIDYQHP